MNTVFPRVFAPAGAVSDAAAAATSLEPGYEYKETRELVALVNDVTELIHAKGEHAFSELRVAGSRWRQDDTYIFVLDPQANALVHPDPALEGMNISDVHDINGKPIPRGLIATVTTLPEKQEGWYHYEWPVPGGLLPRWKSTYVRLATAPSGKYYVVCAGMYNDRMERAFVVDLVKDAVGQIQSKGEAALALFHDPKGPFLFKDAYIFVYDLDGVNLALPAFPNLEGRNLLDMKDTQGQQFIREGLRMVQTSGSGWIDYMWPKPGESISTQKSTYVSKARLGDRWVMVGSGVYLADAPKAASTSRKISAPELMALVREGASRLRHEGPQAYPEFRTQG